MKTTKCVQVGIRSNQKIYVNLLNSNLVSALNSDNPRSICDMVIEDTDNCLARVNLYKNNILDDIFIHDGLKSFKTSRNLTNEKNICYHLEIISKESDEYNSVKIKFTQNFNQDESST
jgi:hypothetical protein